jgi:hypothetical protein
MEYTDTCYPLVENRATYQSIYLAGGKLSKVSGITDNKALPGSAKLTSASAKEAEYNNSRLTSPTVQSNYLQSEGIKTNQRAEQIALDDQQYNYKLSPNLREPVPPNSTTQLELPESPKPDVPKPSTPTRTKASMPVSLQTEEIQRGKIPMFLEITCLLPVSISVVPEDIYILTDYILEAARIIYYLSKYLDSIPRQVYITIFRVLRDSYKDIQISSDWSTGSI